MHILLIHQSFASFDEPGGTRHYELALYLAQSGYRVTIIASPVSYVIMAATPRFPDWYLYAPKLEEEARQAFLRQFAPLDPIAVHIPNLSTAPVLFQFATDDPHVPRERAEELFAAAHPPRELKWYMSGHGLNAEAATDRKHWLKENLDLQQE